MPILGPLATTGLRWAGKGAVAYGILTAKDEGQALGAVTLGFAELWEAGKALGSIFESGEDVVAAGRGVWELDPFKRGRAIEIALGHNLPPNYPVIDRFSNGIATSIKSIDLTAQSYQDAAVLTRTVRGYIDKVAAFSGRHWGSMKIEKSEIAGRALDLAIPAGSATVSQEKVLQGMVGYGRSLGVDVNVVQF
jgi:filamentous hemagglutinin